ncbi:MAG: Cas10/Cmr2 second palm domain-containing protein [Streptosporangiaceae bacterium]
MSGRQTEALSTGDSLAMPVYAGGDDLLAFCPASTAIDAARTCHDEIPPSLPQAWRRSPSGCTGRCTPPLSPHHLFVSESAAPVHLCSGVSTVAR